jgi:GTPase SAR1 family protein
VIFPPSALSIAYFEARRFSCKIVFASDANVGKTSILQAFIGSKATKSAHR